MMRMSFLRFASVNVGDWLSSIMLYAFLRLMLCKVVALHVKKRPWIDTGLLIRIILPQGRGKHRYLHVHAA